GEITSHSAPTRISSAAACSTDSIGIVTRSQPLRSGFASERSTARATASLRYLSRFAPEEEARITAVPRYSPASKRWIDSVQYSPRSNFAGRLNPSARSTERMFDTLYVAIPLPED